MLWRRLWPGLVGSGPLRSHGLQDLRCAYPAYFVPTLKETPAEAQIASHRLMLRAGLMRQTASGIYAWLPVGLSSAAAHRPISCGEEQDAAGAQELLMPTLQSADLWRESGRYDAYGPEMLRIKDRHERDLAVWARPMKR